MNKRRICALAGIVCLLAALCLAGYYLWGAHRAAKSVEHILTEMSNAAAEAPAEPEKEPEDAPETAEPARPSREETEDEPAEETLPEMVIDGWGFIGTIDVPSVGVAVPVMSDWDYEKLKLSPCRYSGSIYSNDLIISGHNYSAHFGKLKNVSVGDEVRFTDANGEVWPYTVTAVERIGPNDVEKLLSGDWDLTLFTCTVGGQARLAVRCALAGI